MKGKTSSIFCAVVLVAIVLLGNAPLSFAALWYKPGYIDYASSGMPDFDQRQLGWINQLGVFSYCGPVSAANSLWWLDSEYETLLNQNPVPPPAMSDSFALVTSYNPGGWDDHDMQNVQPLVNNLAFLSDTDGLRTQIFHSGTNFIDLETGISQYMQQQGINPLGDVDGDGDVDYDDLLIMAALFGSSPGLPGWNMAADINQDNKVDGHDVVAASLHYGQIGMFCEKTVEFPDFAYIMDEIYMCEDVVLNLELWIDAGGGQWQRYTGDPGGDGGHYVTCAGVEDILQWLFLSDPWQDAFEAGLVPGRSPVGHPYPHPTPLHNDAQFVSHDGYPVLSWPGPNTPYPAAPAMLELVNYPQVMGFPQNWHAFIRAAIATSPIQIAVYNVRNMKTGCNPTPTVCAGYPITIDATVQNRGSTPVTFGASAWFNTTNFIGMQTVTLNPQQTEVITFTWSTVGTTEYDQYYFGVHVHTQVPSNGVFTAAEKVRIVHLGDVTGDRLVDINDLSRVSAGFGSVRVNYPSDPRYGQYWHPIQCSTCPHSVNADITGDRIIDIGDLARTSGNYGWHP